MGLIPAPGGGFTPVVVAVELNGNATTDPTPNASTWIDWDTFYDVFQNDTSLVLPTGLGLSYSAGVFEATEDGIWLLHVGVDLVSAPGTTGRIMLNVPSYGFSPLYRVLTAANPVDWLAERHLSMTAGQTFGLLQSNTGSSVDQIDGYASMEIIRIAGSVS